MFNTLIITTGEMNKIKHIIFETALLLTIDAMKNIIHT